VTRSKILIATGSSGGHLLPALTFAEVLEREAPCEIHFLLSRPRNWETPEALKSYQVHWTGSFAFPREFSLGAMLFPFKFLGSFFQVVGTLLRERPALVVGFGGYVSFPVVLVGRLMGSRTLIHEQNRVFGKANRILSRFADRVALSFPPQNGKRDTRFVPTGNILRPSIVKNCENALYNFPSSADKLNILLLGGSQGAQRLNRIFLEALKGLEDGELSQMRVRHITGKLNHSEVARGYESLPACLEREVIPFTEKIDDCFLWSHWVVSRSGAGTVFELMAFGRPSLLVPYPHADSHQIENARFLEEAGAAELIEEDQLTPWILRQKIRSLRTSPEKFKRLAENAKKMRILDASDQVSRLALSLLSSRN